MELLVFQSMWGMEELPGEKGSWSLEEQVDQIAAAGFDGAAVEDDVPEARDTISLLRDRGLKWCVACFPKTIEDFATTIEFIEETGRDGCDHINMQPNVRPATVLESIPYVLGWQQMADQAGLDLYIETHRDRMTTDLLFTLQLIDAVPSLKLTADLSHFLVGREFKWPVPDAEHELIRRILERTWAFHGRVATREQVQVQLSFPHQQRWLELFTHWWEQGFRSWRTRAAQEDTLIFTPELGPPPYAITGPDGTEQSDRWEEALLLQQTARDIWQKLETEDPKTNATVPAVAK